MPADPTSPGGGGFTAPTIEELSLILPQYEISAILGVGGMGAVYKGRQTQLARDVAIKILPAEATGAEGDDEFNFAERFQREAQAMARMHHQRIVAVHDFGEAKTDSGATLLYIIMEFVEGTDLHHLIKTGALTPSQTLAVITQICDALHYAHEQGIVHRDIKPANIMLDVEGNVKVADFGLAKLTGGDVAAQSQLTMTNMAMGTPDYVSPEQLEAGREVDGRADIYSLGVMIYEMLTGEVPRGAFLPPSQKSALAIDTRLDQVVNQAMQTDPDERYQQVSQLWSDVDGISTTPAPATNAGPQLITGKAPVMDGSTGKTAQEKSSPPAPAKSNNGVIVGFTIATILVLSAVAYFVFKPTEESQAIAKAPEEGAAGRPVVDRSKSKGGSGPAPDAPATPASRASVRSKGKGKGELADTTSPTETDPAQAPAAAPAPSAPTPSITSIPPTTGPPPGAVPFAGNHYKFVSVRMQYDAAAAHARELGGYLVSIHSSEENAFVRSLLPANPNGQPWIGLRPQSENLPWIWEDGTTTANFSVWKNRTKPAIAKPDGTEFRGSIRPDEGTWSPVSYAFHGPFIIEWGEPGNSAEAATLTGSPAQGKEWNLLAAIDPVAHAIYAHNPDAAKQPAPLKWERIENGIAVTDGVVGMLMPPIDIPASYDLELRILPKGQMAVTLPIGSSSCTLVINKVRQTPTVGGLEMIDGKSIVDAGNPSTFSPTPVKLNVESTILIRVRKKAGDTFSIEALHDGQPLTSWEGKASSLEPWPHWKLPDAHRIGLGAFTFKEPGSAYLAAILRPVESTMTAFATSDSVAGKKVTAFLADYSEKFKTAFGDIHSAKITSLNTNYGKAIERESKAFTSSGNLDAVLLFNAERDAIAALASGEALLVPLPENAPKKLKDMRATYRKTIQGYEKALANDAGPALRALDRDLERLISDFTRDQKIEDALEVRTFRDQLKTEGVDVLIGAVAIKVPNTWIPLFNGKDLNDWNIGKHKDAIQIDPTTGILTLQGPNNADLYYNGKAAGGSFKDFEFKAMVKTVAEGTSGVFLHLTPQTKSLSYAVQIANQNPHAQKTGSIWPAQGVDRIYVDDGDWFELHFRVEGKTVTVAIDGRTINEFTDPGDGQRRLSEGSIMLQWFSGKPPESAVHFKDIRIRIPD